MSTSIITWKSVPRGSRTRAIASKSPRIERFLASGQKIGARLPKSGANSDRNRREFRCDCPELRSTAGFVRQSIGTTIDGNGADEPCRGVPLPLVGRERRQHHATVLRPGRLRPNERGAGRPRDRVSQRRLRAGRRPAVGLEEIFQPVPAPVFLMEERQRIGHGPQQEPVGHGVRRRLVGGNDRRGDGK